jgi:hypothetical protein
MEGCSGCVLVFALAVIMGWAVKRAIQRSASVRPSSSPEPRNVASADTCLPAAMDGYGYLAVVGESFRQPVLRQIARAHPASSKYANVSCASTNSTASRTKRCGRLWRTVSA